MGEPPRLVDLQRVLGVGRTLTVDDVGISLLAVEVYADGLSIPLEIQLRGERSFDLGLIPEYEPGLNLAWHVSDDLGTRYTAWPLSAGGTAFRWRLHFAFAPQIPRSARVLRINIDEISLRRLTSHGSNDVREYLWRGPWQFDVRLGEAATV